jgi:hypothetical protein
MSREMERVKVEKDLARKQTKHIEGQN